MDLSYTHAEEAFRQDVRAFLEQNEAEIPKYFGVNRPTPYARPAGKAGRNQFTGFFGSHAVALMGYQRIVSSTGAFVRNDAYVMEPNHDSPARPENVPFDIVTQTDLDRSYREVVTMLGWSATIALVPTKAPTFPGGIG